MSIHVVIIEDEPLVARNLSNMIGRLDQDITILKVIGSVAEGIRWFGEHEMPDLIFSDVQLSDGVSFDIFRQVRTEVPVIFTTAYDEYAIRAFRLNSIDYLLKPLDEKDLANAWEKFVRLHRQKRELPFSQQLSQLLSDVNSSVKKYKERFAVHSGQSITSVNAPEVVLFKREELILLTDKDGRLYVTDYHSLEELEELLDPVRFFRANRQYIIQLDAIESYKTSYNGKIDVKMKTRIADEITVSREKASLFKSWFEGMG